MEAILEILRSMFAPLSSEIILAAISAGLFFGAIYNHIAKIPRSFIYHKLVTGLGFIAFMFLFRSATELITEGTVMNPAGWVGIGVLWTIFCAFIWIGDKIRSSTD